MARKNTKKKRRAEADDEGDARPQWHASVADDTKKAIAAIASFIAAILLLLSYAGKGGLAGQGIYRLLSAMLGSGYFFAPIVCVLMGFSFLFGSARKLLAPTAIGGILFLFSSLGILNILFGAGTGGIIGGAISVPLLKLFDFWAGLVLAHGIFVISLLLVFDIPHWWKRAETDEEDEETAAPISETPLAPSAGEQDASLLSRVEALIASRLAKDSVPSEPQPAFPAPPVTIADNDALPPIKSRAPRTRYKKPPFDLLQGDKGTPSSGDIRANANIIKRTLENFGIMVEMGEVAIGPTVTQYTLRPAEGVRLSKIIGLNSNLALALAAPSLRIEAPIPGKSLVGIEVPNRSIALVGLRSLLEHSAMQDAPQPLMVALGRDVTGSPVYADMARMPHLMVSGSTGSGKSVSIHSIVSSLLYRNGPEQLRFIMVDPKRVELSVYNDIPHLLTPVITDAKKTIQVLRWATKEMDRRYDILSETHTRDIASYNAGMARDSNRELLPYIVIIIDELADLMTVYPREVEGSIIRLAQMARAVGIHLIVATQRPSVEVLTGLIKANITSRIAFQVASHIDSRTILDSAGAEKLLGNGDMLFLAGDTGRARRIQGAYVSEHEVKKVVGFLRDTAPEPEYEHEEEMFAGRAEEGGDGLAEDAEFGDNDPLYAEAQALVRDAGKASASYLQRRLRIGYARAARLLDLMEARGIIGPADGAKPREVLSKAEDAGIDHGLM
ncbi:MAG: DNA segregation ATPase FtsK/SpoIIIE, S-DNA-T family [Parcubacteria group bacterium Greene0714_36]|nr:MAG: DNA segregation ATPase FtsK/SpoIIIE, S-DNA-T family [Parcubacteria group bacterium Greene0714_36]